MIEFCVKAFWILILLFCVGKISGFSQEIQPITCHGYAVSTVNLPELPFKACHGQSGTFAPSNSKSRQIGYKAQEFHGQKPTFSKASFILSSGAFWTGSVMDIHSSVGKQELNPFLRKSDGTFSPYKGVGISVGFYGATCLLDWSGRHRVANWLRTVLGGTRTAIAIRNYRIER